VLHYCFIDEPNIPNCIEKIKYRMTKLNLGQLSNLRHEPRLLFDALS